MMTALFRVTQSQARAGRRAALAAAVALGLAGCNTGSPETTGSIGPLGGPSAAAAAPSRQDVDRLAERFNADPADGRTAMAYARALRATDQISQASAVLQQAALRNPRDRALLGAYGKSLVEAGRFREAIDVLANAHTPPIPTGASCRRRARPPPSSASRPARRASTRPPSRFGRTSPRSCPISACPTRCRATSIRPSRPCGSPPTSPAPTRGCGRTSPWSWASRAASPTPRPSCAAT